ncbi:hypothetical protein D3C76_1017610 [compost metagenome]
MDTALVASGSGGWPRPSLMWQLWQALALYSGPRPSRAVVVEGAITQGAVKKLSPTLKSRRCPGSRLADGREKAKRSLRLTVVAPPESASPGSATGAGLHAASARAASRRASREKVGRRGINEVRVYKKRAANLSSWVKCEYEKFGFAPT